MDKAALFALVKDTTRIAQELKLGERIEAAKAVSERTAQTYGRTAARRMNLRASDLGQLMGGVSARSWHATRAALIQVAALQYAKFRRACDQAQKAGDWERAERAAVLARRAVEAIRQVEASERPALEGRRATKRRTLPKSDTWQQVAYAAATPIQKPAVAVLWATGCRPAELEQGVELRKLKVDGKRLIMVTIHGAKVTERSGQPSRKIAIDPDSPAGRALLEAIPLGETRVIISRRAKRLAADFVDIRSRTGLKVSPYSMRHQVGANVKAAMSVEDVAATLGHVATRSQQRYGSVRQAQSGGTGIQAVKATRPVRETRSRAPAPTSGPQPL